jgi:signal transduction histidine kinase
MNLYSIFHFLVSLATIFLGVFVFYKKGRSKSSISNAFLFMTITIFIYQLSSSFVISNNRPTAIFWSHIAAVGVIFMPATFYHFIVNFLDLHEERKVLKPLYILGICFVFLDFTTNLIIRDVKNYYWGYFPLVGEGFFILYIIYFIVVLKAIHCLFIQLNNKKRSEIERYQIKYILIAYLLLLSAGSIDSLPTLGFEIYPIAYLMIFAMLLLIAYAIIKYRLMDIRIAISRAGIFLTVYSFVLGIPFWIGYQTKNWLLPTLSMFILSTAGPLIYRYMQRKAENIILANQRHYQRLLLESAKGMLRVHDLDKLLRFVTAIVKKIVKVKFAAIVLRDQNKNYILKAIKGDKNFPRDFVITDKDPLIKVLKKKKSSLIYDEINYLKNNIVNKQLQLIVPIFMENNLLGFLGLGKKEDHTLYTQDDINVFEILSRQAALAIDHCHFMEEFSKAQEKAFQAEKLASIGGMADGVAHQMKNRLNLFSIVSGEMRSEIEDFTKTHPELVEQNPDLKRYFDYLNKTGDMLISNVRKTNGIIEGILSFARAGEKGTYFSEFSFGEIIDTSIGLLLIKHQIKAFPLEVVVDSSDLVFGVKSQFLECIYNILDNCYEAIKEKMDFYLTDYERKSFKPLIKLKLTHNERFCHIEISDNGTGIKEENRQKIFAPFFTTKPSNKSGSGVGMYVVKRIIEENHKGKIKFESKYMEGTKFFIKLPKDTGGGFRSTGHMSN